MRVEKIFIKGAHGLEAKGETEINACLFQGKVAHRQVSLMGADSFKRLKDDGTKGFCHLRFFPNFVLFGLEIGQVEIGQQYRLGNAIIEVSEVEKECHSHCPAFRDGYSCGLNREMFFAVIVQSGKAALGSKFQIIE